MMETLGYMGKRVDQTSPPPWMIEDGGACFLETRTNIVHSNEDFIFRVKVNTEKESVQYRKPISYSPE